jgi:hypothetical protein
VLAKDLPAFTERTITDPGHLRQMLDEVRATGTSRLEQAFDREVTSQGAPLFDASAKPIGALSVAVPSVRATPEKMSAIRAALLPAAAAATRSLGGVQPVAAAGRRRHDPGDKVVRWRSDGSISPKRQTAGSERGQA